MAKGTETLKEARNIIEEMNLNIDRFNQGLKDSDGFTKKMTNNVAETLQGLHDSRKANKMNGKQLGAVADLGKEILDGNIDVAKSKRMQASLEKKLLKAKSVGERNSIENQLKLLKTRDAAEKVQNKVNLATEVGDKLTGGMASKAGGFLKHMKKVGPVAGGVLLITGLLVKALKFASAITDALGKQFGVMGTSGGEFQKNMQQASIDVISLGKGTSDVVTLVDTLSKDFGITLDSASRLPDQILDTAVALGLSTDESAKLFGTLMTIGNLTADQAEHLAESTYQLARQNNVNPNAVMKDIAESAETIAKFGADNLESITKAAIKARQLGLNLSTVDSIADSLLDFQTSLTSEIEASVMIGKDLNFQKARELALSGDLNGMMENVTKQLGGQAEFNKLNVLQRKSLAKSLGLEVKQMEKLISAQDKSIVQQKSFNDLMGKDGMSSLTSITNKLKEIGASVLKEIGVPLEKALGDFEDKFFTEENIQRMKLFFRNMVEVVQQLAKAAFNLFKGIYKFVGIFVSLPDFDELTPTMSATDVNDFQSSGGSHLVVTPTGKMLTTNPKDTVFGTTAVNDFASGPMGSLFGDVNAFTGGTLKTNALLSKIIEQNETLINETRRGPDRMVSGIGDL
jgi:hypothetical protein